MARLEAQDLVCVRGERTVFTGLGFTLDAGEALVLSGPNGSGKSSLLRLIAGLLHPAEGRLIWDGSPVVDDLELHRARLCYVGHQDPVKAVLTVRENLLFWAGLAGRADDAAEAALARLGLATLANVPGRFLSAGQRRRLNLARLLIGRVPLWLLDEPTIALDKAAVATLENMIATHCSDGGLSLIATHAPLGEPAARTLELERFAPAERMT
jgi:heme exporter protein A